VAERRRRKTPERRSFSILPTGMLTVVRWAFVLRPFAEYLPVWYCKASNRLGFEFCYSQRWYYFVIQSACNVLMYQLSYNIILLSSQKKTSTSIFGWFGMLIARLTLKYCFSFACMQIMFGWSSLAPRKRSVRRPSLLTLG
jgi:hypothetical protein